MRDPTTRDKYKKIKFESMRKYCQVRRITFDIDYWDLSRCFELPCIFCKKKDATMNRLSLHNPMLGVIPGNIRSTCYICTRNTNPGFY